MSHSPEPKKVSRLARFLPFLRPPHHTYDHLVMAGFGHRPTRRALKHTLDPVEATKWATHYAHRESGHVMFLPGLALPAVCTVCKEEAERRAAGTMNKRKRNGARAEDKAEVVVQPIAEHMRAPQWTPAQRSAALSAARSEAEAAERPRAPRRPATQMSLTGRTTTSSRSAPRNDGGNVDSFSGHSGGHSCGGGHSGGGGGGGDSGGGGGCG